MTADASQRSLLHPWRIAYTHACERSRSPKQPAWRSLLVAVAACGLALSGCGDEELARVAPPPPPVTTPQVGHVPLEPTCADGTVEPCSTMLGEHDGIVSCVEGTRLCEGGVFGECSGGRSFSVTREPQSGASLRPFALSSATDCTNNPCNSYCREFNEAPSAGLVPDDDPMAPPLSSWITGNVSDYPPEWVVVGNQEPCQVAGDCQFNTSCQDPSPGSCSHTLCAEGDALAPGCNRCADTVCAANADCCGTAPTCAHDPCEVGSGAPLDPTCDTCVDAVCTAHPECCSATWNDLCVSYVATECTSLGQSCSCPDGGAEVNGACIVASSGPQDFFSARDACGVFGDGWLIAEIADATENSVAAGLLNNGGIALAWLGGIETGTDQWSWQSSGLFFTSNAGGGVLEPGYYANWATGEPELGVAGGRGIAVAADGGWSDAPLDFALGYLCEGPKNRLGPKQSAFHWGPECVELAESACGVTCPDNVPLGIGACTARVPTDLDERCPGYDLALGATCEAGALPQIPVCNHGQTAAPAGLRLVHLPITQMGNPAPDMTGAGDCVLSEPIPAGRCVTVTDCPGLVADRALVVNPGAPGQDTTECRVDDNWSIYQPLACRATTCESSVHAAGQVKADDCSIELSNPLGVDPELARVTVGTNVPEPGCGTNEVLWGTSCYYFATDSETWDSAQDLCRGKGPGWDLVALNSPAENAWVRSGTDSAQDIQIGFNDKDTEADHVWSNGSCRAYTNWDTASFSPNNTPPGSEQCVRMTAAAGAQWEDKACNDGEHPYVCEGPVRDARGGCQSGQIAGPDGSCYSFERGGRSFDDAEGRCLAMGPGWQLATIDNGNTNAFVTSLIGCTPTWLNNPPSLGSYNSWSPALPDLTQDPFIDELGVWHTTDDGVARATLCRGPATATGAPELEQVANASACSSDEQFYFVGNETAPELLMLCPTTCQAAAALPGRRIEVEIPCLPPAPPKIETEYTDVYEPECNGTQPQWDFLYYDAVTPADSRIEFAVRSAATQEELDADTNDFVVVAEAHAVPTDTQRCEVNRAGCPVDLFHALADAGQSQQVDKLELRIRLLPGSSGEGPVLRDWKVRFSCPPAQ